MQENVRKEIESFKKEFPKFYDFVKSVIEGKSVEDGKYSSEEAELGNTPWNCTKYCSIENNVITAIGQELGREGGWYWFNKDYQTPDGYKGKTRVKLTPVPFGKPTPDFTENPVMFADSYKYSQPKQMPSGTVGMFDYLEARGGDYNEIVAFSAQYNLKRYFSKPITKAMVDEAAEYAELHGEPFEYAGWMYIVNELGGKLPVRIKAVAEGTVMPVSVPLMTIESTDEKVYWVVSWFETFLLKVWYGTTVASRTRAVIKVIEEYRRETGGLDGLAFAYHDFSDRGCSSVESAAIAGMARLAAGSMGTDNFNSLRYAREFYGIQIAGFSIVASEHSTVTSWGKDGEFDMYEAYIERFKSKAIMACVMDSYNIFEAMKYITSGTFKEKIESDEYPMFVIRPDSGIPVEILNAILNTMEDNSIKFTVNDEGYKVFNKYRIIWGDGINVSSIREMLEYMKERGYSADNIAFGSGGWGSQVLDRDTSKFAIKCSNVTIQTTPNGKGGYNTIERDVFKDPITDKGKTSKKGKITTYFNTETGKYEYGPVGLDSETMIDVLEVIFENGELMKDITFDEVRANSSKAA